MKKVTFPHMGNLKIPGKALFQEMGIDVVLPPKNSKRTLDLGVKYSPEFSCLPLKITLGNFIEALEKGADTIVMAGGCGPCRFGYYAEIQKDILNDLGYDFEIIMLEPEIVDAYKKLRYLFGGFNFKKVFRAGKLAWIKLLAMDEIHQLAAASRAREEKEGQVNNLHNEFLNRLDETNSFDRIEKLKQEYTAVIKDCLGRFKRGKEIKIGIVGEIYLAIEPFANIEVEKKLGELGATVIKEVYLSHWIRHFLNVGKEFDLIKKAAQPFLNNSVGGHGVNTIGNTVRFSRQNCDGIVHLAPFTCMPEIVAQTILPEVEKQEQISVLSLFLDEHRGEAGLITRLEAFVDLLYRKKFQKQMG